jgi:hypothetical protein
VIPLRPLGVGEILDGAVTTMRTHWRTVLGVAFVVALVSQAAIALLQGLALYDSGLTTLTSGSGTSANDVVNAFGGLLAASGLALLITLLGIVVATAMLTMVTSRAVLGRHVTAREAWAEARPQFFRLLGLTALLALIGALIMGVGILPGLGVVAAGSDAAGAGLLVLGILGAFVVIVWLLVRFCLASPALMLEKQGVFKAMKRSVKLVQGSWWRIFGIQLLTVILVYIVTSIIQIPFVVVGAITSSGGLAGFSSGSADSMGWSYLIISGIGAVIGSTVTFPISAGVTALLYVDQRIRREALDLELARAAGVPGFGTSPPAGGTSGVDSATAGG